MNRALLHVSLLLGIVSVLTSCTTTEDRASADADAPSQRMRASHGMPAVMHAKLAHTQAIVEGIAISDYGRVERNATALVELSERGSWMVHETMAYVAFSDDFRNTARTLARDAQLKDADRVVDHYSDLVRTCVACHDYLRKERLIKDMPGEVSQSAVERLHLTQRNR